MALTRKQMLELEAKARRREEERIARQRIKPQSGSTLVTTSPPAPEVDRQIYSPAQSGSMTREDPSVLRGRANADPLRPDFIQRKYDELPQMTADRGRPPGNMFRDIPKVNPLRGSVDNAREVFNPAARGGPTAPTPAGTLAINDLRNMNLGGGSPPERSSLVPVGAERYGFTSPSPPTPLTSSVSGGGGGEGEVTPALGASARAATGSGQAVVGTQEIDGKTYQVLEDGSVYLDAAGVEPIASRGILPYDGIPRDGGSGFTSTVTGQRQPGERPGTNNFRITRTNPFQGASNAAIAPFAAQRRAGIAARRFGGGSAGNADVMQQVNRIHQAADKAFFDVRNATNNSKAAERAANVIRSRADSLLNEQTNRVGFGRNASYNYATDVNAQLRQQEMSVEMQQLATEMQQLATQRGYDIIDQLATFNTPDGDVTDYNGVAIASDLLNFDPRNAAALQRNGTAVRGLMKFRQEYLNKVGYLPDAAEMERFYNQAEAATNLEFTDIFKEGDINALDVFMSNIGFGPNAYRLGEDQAFKADPRNFTRDQRDRFRLRDRDRNR